MNALLLLVVLGAAAELRWSAGLEEDDGGLTSYGETGQWEWGSVVIGPGSSFDGSACWGTLLDRWYLNDATDHLQLPPVALDAWTRPVLGFQQWISVQEGDLAFLEVRREGGWEPLAPIYGYPGGGSAFSGQGERWAPVWVDLTGLDAADRLRLTFASDPTGAAPGWYVDNFELWDGDPVPPDVALEACLEDTDDLEGPYRVDATVRDDVALESVDLLFQVDGGLAQVVPLLSVGEDRWVADLPGQSAGSSVVYGVWATDGQNQAFGPDPSCAFSVRLPAPTGLRGPDGLVWGSTVRLVWLPPESTHTIEGYRVWRDDTLVAEVTAPVAEAPLVSGWQTFSVSARYDVGEGERSRGLPVEAAVPTITALEPAVGFQGDRLRLALRGEYLLMQQDEVEVDLGAHIRVTDLEVRDVDLAWVTVFVSGEAPAGPVDLTLTTWGVDVWDPAAFEILPGEDRPRLLSVAPDTVRQGDAADVLITASEPFLEPPEVRIVDEVVVEDVSLDGDGNVRAHLVVPYTTPIGDHAVEVDDGTRIFGGLALTVRDRSEEVPPGRCAAVPRGWAWGWPLTAVTLGLLARRTYRPRRRPPSTGRETPRT